MGDENHIRTLGDYSKPSHEGYRNTIELPVGNNVVPLRSDTIRLMQNGCSFHGLRSEDPNQHLKDFLKLTDSLDIDGSITTWKDLTTRFLAQFFPSHRTKKLCKDILMFQQHHGESLSEAWTRFKDLLQKIPHHGIDCWLQIQIFYDHVSFHPRVRDYMAVHTEQMERFENPIFKQREEINDRMNEMFELLKELTTSKAPEKVLIKEEAKFPITKNVNSISFTRGEEETSGKTDVTTGDDFEKTTEMLVKKAVKEDEAENEPNRKAEKEKTTEAPSSQPVEYYLKHRINGKLIKGLVGNHRKKITRKWDIRGNFKIPCNIGGPKHMNALVYQGSDVNVMPLSTYMKLIDDRPAKTDIRLFLASHSYIYPLEIAEDVLVKVFEIVYPVNFLILDIKKDKRRPFILGMPFLTTAKVVIKFDKGTITLRSGKSKINFHRIPESFCKIKRGFKNDIEPIAPTMTVNRLVLNRKKG
nr:hypothetical protein [Tanacetum cinerariifolium]